MRDLNLHATPSRLTLISPALLQHKEMVHKKLTSPGCRVNKMMMKYKVYRVLIYTSNFFSTRSNLLSSEVASYTFFT